MIKCLNGYTYEILSKVWQILSEFMLLDNNSLDEHLQFSLIIGHHGNMSNANGPGDLGSIPGRVIPKTLKMELDTTLLNTQHYKVRFKGKVEQSREWSSALPYTLV